MTQITAQQCRDARNLLRWNIKDLAYKSNVPAKRLHRFEEALETLFPDEQVLLHNTFTHEDIIFTEGGGIKQKKKRSRYVKRNSFQGGYRSPSAEMVLARLLSHDNEEVGDATRQIND